jgi:hypothetical protein
MTEDMAWQQLLDLIEAEVAKVTAPVTRLSWLRSNRVLLSGRWQVQARLAKEGPKYAVYFERFGAENGFQNVDLLPWETSKRTVWTMLLEMGNTGGAFWRFSATQVITSPALARRIINRLQDFHEEFGRSFLDPERTLV